MRNHSPRRLPRFLKKHFISILIIIVALGAAGGFYYWYSSTKNAEIQKIEADSKALTIASNKKLAEIKAVKAAKAAKEAAELKAKQEAEAKAAAEAARVATEATAINSASCNTSKSHNNPASIDVVVNKKHCMSPVKFVPGDLTTVIDSKGTSYPLSTKAAAAFNSLSAAAVAADQAFYLTSSYRSYNEQVSTYAYWVNTSGAAGADTYSARPGYSEHQTGLVFDVAATVGGKNYVLSDFSKTSQYQWLVANAADYGFIQRYYAGYEGITGYSAEEWHYRYVGVAVAKDMQAKGIKTLEQYWGVIGGDYY